MNSTSVRLGAAALATAIVLGGSASAYAQGRHHHRHNNDGAAAAAIIGGLALGAIIANSAPAPAYAYPPPAYAYPAPGYVARSPHADWCAVNTPGYNPYDNTYQGYYAGERIYCRSPYGG